MSIPPEVWNHILTFIDDRNELLALSLASKYFASLVEPHLEYCAIRCTLATTDLWKKLGVNEALAQNVRWLSIQRQYTFLGNIPLSEVPLPPVVPREFVESAYDTRNRTYYTTWRVEGISTSEHTMLLEAERYLIQALKNMSNLISFKWEREPPMLNSVGDEETEEDVWTVLRDKCPLLEDLSVVDVGDNHVRDVKLLSVHQSAIWTLSQNLKSFSYETHCYGYSDMPALPVDELKAMIRRCSHLESLRVMFMLYSPEWDGSDDDEDIPAVDFDDLLADVYWPKLRILSVGSIHVSLSTAVAFFERHPTITSLNILEHTEQARFIKSEGFWNDLPLYEVATPRLSLMPGTLPNLEHVNVPWYISQALRRRKPRDQI